MLLTINGTAHELDIAGNETLLSVVRNHLKLTGTKLSCGRGECGACTVLLAAPQAPPRVVYSCLTLAVGCEHHSVTTIEGLADGGALSALQQAFIERDAVQCGFCTPGQLLAAAALLAENPAPDEAAIRVAMSGNLCRCGTYPKIVLAIQDAARRITDAE
jgi:aerobic-type carbon monoxide dehydrogenase small subunit (CoxS/CutS family)